MQIVLYQPQIPPNTGAVARLCAATQTTLHLIHPIGFSLEDKYLKRAGLDYWPYVDLKNWENWENFLDELPRNSRLIMTTARRGISHVKLSFRENDYLVLGPESDGLPQNILSQCQVLVRIPIWGPVRSLNLSSAAAVILYEALRQTRDLE